MKKYKKIISLALAFVMVLGMLPMNIFAGGGEKTVISQLRLSSNIGEILKVGHAVEPLTLTVDDPLFP